MSLTALLLAQAASAALPLGAHEGQCRYGEEVVERASGTTLITCNQAELRADGVTFSLRSWGPRVTFNGVFDGPKMRIDGAAFRDGAREDATGECQLFFTNDRLSVVTCTAMVQRRSYAANFVISRI